MFSRHPEEWKHLEQSNESCYPITFPKLSAYRGWNQAKFNGRAITVHIVPLLELPLYGNRVIREGRGPAIIGGGLAGLPQSLECPYASRFWCEWDRCQWRQSRGVYVHLLEYHLDGVARTTGYSPGLPLSLPALKKRDSQISGESEGKRGWSGHRGRKPSSSEVGEVSREEIESETRERHLTCPPKDGGYLLGAASQGCIFQPALITKKPSGSAFPSLIVATFPLVFASGLTIATTWPLLLGPQRSLINKVIRYRTVPYRMGRLQKTPWSASTRQPNSPSNRRHPPRSCTSPNISDVRLSASVEIDRDGTFIKLNVHDAPNKISRCAKDSFFSHYSLLSPSNGVVNFINPSKPGSPSQTLAPEASFHHLGLRSGMACC